MKGYTLNFPPEMNNKNYRKTIVPDEQFITIPLEGKFKSKKRTGKGEELSH